MNADQNMPDRGFAGHGMRMISKEENDRENAAAIASHRIGSGGIDPDETEAFADAVDAALSEPIPPATSGDRAIFERSIAARRAEKAKQLRIASEALLKVRQLTVSIRAMEDSLDGLLIAAE